MTLPLQLLLPGMEYNYLPEQRLQSDMDAIIYEQDEQTGRVDLSDRTFEYDGDNEYIRATLQKMERGDMTVVSPVIASEERTVKSPPSVPEEANHPAGVEVVPRGGKSLGRHLRRAFRNGHQGAGETRVEPAEGSFKAQVITLDDPDDANENPLEDSDTDGDDSDDFVGFDAVYGPPSEQPWQNE